MQKQKSNSNDKDVSKSIDDKKSIFHFFAKKPSSKNSIEYNLSTKNDAFKKSFTVEPVTDNTNNNVKKSTGPLSEGTNKSLENKLLKTQDVDVKKTISISKTQNINATVENQGQSFVKPNLKPSSYINPSLNSNSTVLVNKKSEYAGNLDSKSSPSNISDTNKIIIDDEKEKNIKIDEKNFESHVINNLDEKSYKKQMIHFLNHLPKCGPKFSTRDVAFKWLNAYLHFLTVKKYNKTTDKFDGDGETFHAFAEHVLIKIIHQAAYLCEKENMLLKLKIPKNQSEIIVMSDIHGSLADLIRAFLVYGLPGDKTYLFLGDYVDRGDYEVEIIILLFILKICFPYSVFLLRGNHEFQDQNRKNDFPKKCKKQFISLNYWKLLNFAFNRLSIAAIIEDKIYCAHGGVSQWIKGKESIEKLVKPMDQNKTLIERLIITDIVWSDTLRNEKDSEKKLFLPTVRGIGYAYTEEGLKRVLKLLGVEKIIRGHHPHLEGFYEDYGEICYTIHTSQLEDGSKGSICKVMKDPKTSEVSLKALNYKINSFFNGYTNINKAIDVIRGEYLTRYKEFFDHNHSKNANSQNSSATIYNYTNIESTSNTVENKECFYCSNYNFLMRECCSRRRMFVTHQQICSLMNKYNYIKRIGYNIILKSINSDLKNNLCLTGFPSFIDFFHRTIQRHPELITDEEMNIIKQLNKGIFNFRPLVKKMNTIKYNILSNQMFYDNDENSKNVLTSKCYSDACKKNEKEEDIEIKDLNITLENHK
ncbi:Serine/threonine-protein phosphatase 5 [Strongyloides ratti]|uniref:Serine/threonine-protein phosphatase n=1 Tax=Strongyloides ratti TaxID=34506 RepID=A0A090KYJ4_STRRB|nr:Serine/threonine-protein phosphatase 5 [Strongyloides ratti]CEF62511.1 Serine/threonine-protein phosphatase 5 [Strongyloides ratti]